MKKRNREREGGVWPRSKSPELVAAAGGLPPDTDHRKLVQREQEERLGQRVRMEEQENIEGNIGFSTGRQCQI